MKLKYTVYDEKFYDIIDISQELEIVEDGFMFIEGTIWEKSTQTLLFNDIPLSRTYQYNKEKGLGIFREFTNKGNGNTFDNDGNILVCEQSTSCLVRVDRNGENRKVLASHYEGKELNSPNDVVVKKDGKIYFTDPTFGRTPSIVGIERKRELDFQGVYCYYEDEDKLVLLNSDFGEPNGLCFSGDEQYLFVNDSERMEIKKFVVQEDGTLTDGYLWATTIGDGPGAPDGMKVDSEDNVFCTAQGGVHIFDKEGLYLGVVEIPEHVGNCVFGGEKMDTLYVAASKGLYSFKIKGHAE